VSADRIRPSARGGVMAAGRRGVSLVLLIAGSALSLTGILGLAFGWGKSSPSTTAPQSVATPASSSPTPTQAPTVSTPTPAMAAAFVTLLGSGIHRGDTEFLVANLDPAVVNLYGEQACRAHLAQFHDQTFSFAVRQVGPLQRWTWAVDGRSVGIPQAFAVTAVESTGGRHRATTVHVAARGTRLGWFTDCGTPHS
jgi:hypothetical protein